MLRHLLTFTLLSPIDPLSLGPLPVPAALAAGSPGTSAPPALTLELDGVPPAEEARVDPASGDLVLRRDGVELGRVPGVGALSGLSLQREQSDGVTLIAARGRRGAQAWLVLAGLQGGRLALLHDGPVGLIGRDGEHSVTVSPRPDALTRHQSAPGVTRCDGEARLFLERYQGGRWQPLIPPLPPGVARGPRPAPSAKPAGDALPVFRFTAASAQAGVDRADQLAPPRELEDGRPATTWRVSGDARGAWVTARAQGAARRVRGLFLVPPSGAPGLRPPQTLAAVFADGRGVLFDVLPGPQWLPLPEPVASDCVSLVVVSGAPAGMTTALAEVRVASDLDEQGPRGLAQLAAGTGPEADAAARALALLAPEQGGALLGALADALPGARGPGRQRLLALLAPLCQRTPAGPGLQREAAALLRRLLGTGAEAERRALWPLLDGQGAEGAQALQALATDPATATPVRAEALLRLGRRGDTAAVQVLLDALPDRGGPLDKDDPQLQRAALLGLSAALRCQPITDPRWVALLDALRQAGTGEARRPARAAALVEVAGQALSGCPDAALRASVIPALLAVWPAVWAQSAQAEPDFLLSLRLLRALTALRAATPESARQVGQVLTERTARAADPVLRAAAAEAAAVAFQALGPAQGERARRGVADSDPGVRVAALQALAGQRDAATVITIEQALAGDRWPQVRRAAVEARAAACGAPTTKPDTRALRAALRDPDAEVQRLALTALPRCEGAAAADLLAEVARREDAAPPLRGTACGLLGASGASAQPVLARVLADVLTAPSPEESYLAMALRCTRAYGQVAGGADGEVLTPALAPEAPAVLRLAALQSLGQACERRAAPLPASLQAALGAAGRETDGRVRAAAARARELCAPTAKGR